MLPEVAGSNPAPLRKTGPDLRKRRGWGLLTLNRCPQTVHRCSGCGLQPALIGRGSSAQRLGGVPEIEPFGDECLGFKTQQSGQAVVFFAVSFQS
jgi:hypothetical protein